MATKKEDKIPTEKKLRAIIAKLLHYSLSPIRYRIVGMTGSERNIVKNRQDVVDAIKNWVDKNK